MATMSFFRMKERARRLAWAELRRHASISLDNRHFCRQCFTCACLEVMREHRSCDKWQGTETPHLSTLKNRTPKEGKDDEH